MIRWRFVLSRLLILIVVIALLRWGLGPVANYATIRGMESATGAKVEIGETRVGLFPPSVHYSDVHIADPRTDKAMRDAVTAEAVEFVIDGDALLHRRLVAREGRISGLQIGGQRESSGHKLQPEEPTSLSNEPSMLSRLLGATANHVSQQADAVVDGSETMQRGNQIRERWQQQYKDVIVRARNLEKQIRDVRDRARGIDNPLRDWPEFERTLADAREARNELLAVQQELNALPQRLEADLTQLNEAKQADIAKVDQFIPGDLSGTSEFGVDMMVGAVREQIKQVRAFLDGGRAIAGMTVVAPEQSRIRGHDYDLEELHRPQLMIRRCEVGGVLRNDGERYTMTGIVENLTPTPELLAEPTRTRLSLEGPERVRVEFVRDRRGTAEIDMLTVHWPTMEAKPVSLGDQQDAGIAVAGGDRELWVQLRTEGDQIDGRLVSKRTGVRIELSVEPTLEKSAAFTSLQQSLASVDRIEVDARFGGTWKDIDLELNTNLNQIMRRATRDAIDGQLRQTRQQLTAKINQVHTEQTARLRSWLGEQQGEALSLLASADKSIEEMSAKVFDEVGSADKYLGKLRGAIQGKVR